MAADLSHSLNRPVIATSLLHSNRVDPDCLDGQPAILLEEEILRLRRAGTQSVTLLPWFIGPSLALTDYLPDLLDRISHSTGRFHAHRADSLARLAPTPDLRLADLLSAQVTRALARLSGEPRPEVIVVDHGSPVRAVTDIRNAVADRLAEILGDRVSAVSAASMERREGREYDFNEPLLEDALNREDTPESSRIVAMLFLSPGRHAGPGGDIVGICRRAQSNRPDRRILMTGLVGENPQILDILGDRLKEAEATRNAPS